MLQKCILFFSTILNISKSYSDFFLFMKEMNEYNDHERSQ